MTDHPSPPTELRPPGAQPAPRAVVSLRIDREDSVRAVTLLALVGLVVAVGMAIFGLPPWDLHTPLHHAGIMDPLCGGTRSVRLAAMGRWGESWAFNPLGIPVLLLFIALLVRAAVGFTTHRWYAVAIGWTRRRRLAATAVVIILLVLLEIRQQSIAPLLMGS